MYGGWLAGGEEPSLALALTSCSDRGKEGVRGGARPVWNERATRRN